MKTKAFFNLYFSLSCHSAQLHVKGIYLYQKNLAMMKGSLMMLKLLGAVTVRLLFVGRHKADSN